MLLYFIVKCIFIIFKNLHILIKKIIIKNKNIYIYIYIYKTIHAEIKF